MSKSCQYLLVAITTLVVMYCVGRVWGLVTAAMVIAISYCVISPAAQDGRIACNQGQRGNNSHHNQGQRGIDGAGDQNRGHQDVLINNQPGFLGDVDEEHPVRAQRHFNEAQKQSLKTLLAQTRYPSGPEIDQLMLDDAFMNELVARDRVVKWFSRINVQAKELLDEANEEITALTQALGRHASL